MGLHDYHRPDATPVADPAAIVEGRGARFTVLTPRLLRLEYDPTESFEDRPSQTVWHRDLPVPDFRVEREGDRVLVETDALRLRYDPDATDAEGFTPETLSIELLDSETTWRYGDEDDANLGGTRRSLDRMRGPQSLDPGLLSRSGWTLLDDSETWVFDDEWVAPREAHPDAEDCYFFGYGRDYLACLGDFVDLTGDPPLVPRWALGNWWSRYWEYSQGELLDLMAEFRERSIPLSVCVVDMDWHVTDHPNDIWLTGWTWDEELFPDPAAFVQRLHDDDLRTTLNVHPADGVYPHEDVYEAVAEYVGLDPDSEEPIPFDATDPTFLGAYFEALHNPFEDELGIDFWWMDDYPTRFPTYSRPGARVGDPDEYAMAFRDELDATWALNHLHALDRTRDGRRPFTLSRWAGLGGHRYPACFSADVFVDWDTLSFEVPFTAAASNVGFGWWSHDVGGHFGGTGDPETFGELYARWVQFGLWSPILRLHAPKDRWIDKRPWTFPSDLSGPIVEALRLRHALVPYLYSLAWTQHETGVPPIRPLYYHAPEAESAYHCPQAYHVGEDVVVAPHTEPRDGATNSSRQSVWLPEGEWVDLFSGRRYEGGRWHARYGDIEDVPVYARAGALVPLAQGADWGEPETPERVRLLAVAGADGSFDVYDDAGTGQAYREGERALTTVESFWEAETMALSISAAEGDRSVLSDERSWQLEVRSVVDPDDVTATVAGEDRSVETSYDDETTTLSIDLGTVPTDASATVELSTDGRPLRASDDAADRQARLDDLLADMALSTTAKEGISRGFDPEGGDFAWLGAFTTPLADAQARALLESITGAGLAMIDADGHQRAVLFNPEGLSAVTYRFSAWRDDEQDPERAAHSESGVVPASTVLDLDTWADADWELELAYGDVYRLCRSSGE